MKEREIYISEKKRKEKKRKEKKRERREIHK